LKFASRPYLCPQAIIRNEEIYRELGKAVNNQAKFQR
jgi:hypothetical protein